MDKTQFTYWYERFFLQSPSLCSLQYDDEKMWEAWQAAIKHIQNNKNPLAYLYEEYDVRTGELLKSYLWSFHPNQLSYLNDLKNTTHHIKITPLYEGEPVEEYKGISKYDAKRLAEANGGL